MTQAKHYLLQLPRNTIIRLSTLDLQDSPHSNGFQIKFDWWTRGGLSNRQVRKFLTRFVVDATWCRIYEETAPTRKIRQHLKRMRAWEIKHLDFGEESDVRMQQLKIQEEHELLQKSLKKTNAPTRTVRL